MSIEVMVLTDLLGHEIVEVEQVQGEYGGDKILFYRKDGNVVEMYHCQDCCESVSIEDIDGNLQDIVGVVIEAEEVTKDAVTNWGSETWTFFKIATENGFVNIRWYGESNGYYSETVTVELKETE